MLLERYFVEGLAHASYLVADGGEAMVVDPKRDVDEYLAAAERLGVKIVGVFVTHAHADYVGGHVELAQRAGATIYHSAKAPAKYAFHGLNHNDLVTVGGLRVKALDTPGHTPDSMSYYIDAGTDRVVFSGDALFVGDVGRPDLVDMKVDPHVLAGQLFDTLHDVLYSLPDDTVVYPAHGHGSLCGRKIGTAPSTTITAEKTFNWANQFETKDAFIEAMVANLPDRPYHFYYDPFVNLAGPRPLAELTKPKLLEPAELLGHYGDALVIDTRKADDYLPAHLAGSLNVGLHSPMFSTWVGATVRPETQMVLVAYGPEDAEKAWLDLARIGYETVAGYVLADPAAWAQAGLPVRASEQIEVCCIEAWKEEGRKVLDVRTPGEWESGHLDGSVWVTLSKLLEHIDELPQAPLAVLCGTGYRSPIAVGILERAGRTDVVNIRGGWAAYAQRECREPDQMDVFCREVIQRYVVAA
jgi:glyoxylase-like metal-dependent hydrolase (beta-lactamase superfamily II)/rhodanese-related sulfurtransferase